MILDKIIDSAYELYMPQIRSEIESLTRFVSNRYKTSLHEPYNILEIGTKFGGTFYIWNQINVVNSKFTNGINISIDMSDGGKHGGISEEDMDKRDLWFYERFNNCHFIRGDSHSYGTKGKLINLLSTIDFDSVKSREPIIDFLFIDGDHTYEGVKQDFEMYSPFVKPGGIIAFHDIVDSERHRNRDVYVAKFWNEIKNDYEHHEFVEEGNDWGGIGVIIKK